MKPLFRPGQIVRPSNNKGSAFVQALIAVGVVGIMLYYLSPEVIKHRQQVTKTASIITARLALHSMVDFTLLGIKQRWCFSKEWMPEQCGGSPTASMTQILSHPRSVERLLMKKETVDFLRVMMGIANADKIPLDEIDETIYISSFSAMHPVYKIVGDLKGYKVDAIKVLIERDRSGVIPEYGREVYLTVKVALVDSTGHVIEVGSSKLETTSRVGVYPRELGSFGLIVAGDLHMDKPNPGSGAKGDAYLRQLGSRNVASKYPHLIFESPVFVNGSVHLPVAPSLNSEKTGIDTVYTPVVFKDKVVMGDGPVMRNGKEFRPRSSGDETDQFWSNIRQFGGFKKGVEVDGDRDIGLDYLSGYMTGTGTVDQNLMAQCILNDAAKYKLPVTANSQLGGQLVSGAGNKYHYRMALTDRNRFNPQGGEVRIPTVVRTGLLGELLKRWNLDKKDQAIAKYTMRFGSMEVTGEIPDNGTVTLEPEINLKGLKDQLDTKIRDATAALNAANAQLDDIKKEIQRANDDLNDAEAELKAEQEKNNPDKQKIRELNNRIDNYKDKIRIAERQMNRQKEKVADAEQAVNTLQAQKQAVIAKEGMQPKINISIKAPVNPKDPMAPTNPSFRDMDITFENQELFVDSNGNPMQMSLLFEAYDVSYYMGSSLRSWSFPGQENNTKGLFRFMKSGDGFQVSQRMLDPNGGYRRGIPEDVDPYLNLDAACKTVDGAAFGGSEWSKSFAPNSRHSWSFTNSYETRTDLIFDKSNAHAGPGSSTAVFSVVSMAKNCIIKKDANFVTGFYTCERLTIEPRNEQLRIIGTFIVTNGLDIDPTAYANGGVRWSSIYHPQATFELRKAGVLRGMSGQDCSSIARYPVWHPYPSMTNVANLYRCNAVSLRAKADPFRWTSVDPDCGLAGGNSTICKNRLVRFYVLEVSRESGL